MNLKKNGATGRRILVGRETLENPGYVKHRKTALRPELAEGMPFNRNDCVCMTNARFMRRNDGNIYWHELMSPLVRVERFIYWDISVPTTTLHGGKRWLQEEEEEEEEEKERRERLLE
uniref:Uncharacterized protein n=1 Tax=Vespula pensylvanica TaxID=30213 RepID=A0A834PGJ1_VESPE|nr:hypothetical protein H0235_001733 [Vespula pensylvanica]